MVQQAMGDRWTTNKIRLSSFALLILILEIHVCFALNSEGLALLALKALVDDHPTLTNWNPNDAEPCKWSGVHCVNGEVHMLDLSGQNLQGVLAPEIGNLINLRYLDLSKNQLFGTIPPQLGQLTFLEVLDLRDNNLSGAIPTELGGLYSLKRLFLCNNKFEGSIPSEFGKLKLITDLPFDENLTSDLVAGIGCVNRKFGHCIWQGGWKQIKGPYSFLAPIKGTVIYYLNLFPMFKFRNHLFQNHADDSCCNVPSSSKSEVSEDVNVQSLVNSARRKLVEQSSNLAAAPPNFGAHPNDNIIALPSSRSSGSFPAVPDKKKLSPPPMPSAPVPPKNESQNADHPDKKPKGALDPTGKRPPADDGSGDTWKYIIVIFGAILVCLLAVAILIACRSKAARAIGPWKTGLSGQLQKAFVTGVPKLNRAELETACEDFSNIIHSYGESAMVYKGTLSSGVEIAVTSTSVASVKDWSKSAEIAFRKKIDTLSRVNHKNFVNLIGYCEENEPFARMMVFEYAPSGTVFEHLHVKEIEHLDWSQRMRIIMGTAYCLQHMHDLSPPVPHSNLTSRDVFLTDDYAAKIAEVRFWAELLPKSKTSHHDSKTSHHDSEHSELPPLADVDTNIYSFGTLLLEIISGKLPHSEEQGLSVDWAAQYLIDKNAYVNLVDPTLQSYKEKELEIICEVIKECIQEDARRRPPMKEIVPRLREVLDISPEAAVPRLSPLWWAELEILSAEAA